MRVTFALRGQLAFVQRCLSDEGRHSFMSGQPTSSANVFLDCKATTPFSSSEPHEQWATGNLYDNIQAPLTARFWKNINIGWAGTNTVFWNCEGSFLVQKPPTAQNFSFGHPGVNAVVFNIPVDAALRLLRRFTCHSAYSPSIPTQKLRAWSEVAHAGPRGLRPPRKRTGKDSLWSSTLPPCGYWQ